MAVVVLPTPPFWFAIAMTLPTTLPPRYVSPNVHARAEACTRLPSRTLVRSIERAGDEKRVACRPVLVDSRRPLARSLDCRGERARTRDARRTLRRGWPTRVVPARTRYARRARRRPLA